MGNERTLSTDHKRRGVISASITRLDNRVAELERKKTLLPVYCLTAKGLLPKLNELDAEFRSYHFAVIDLVDEEHLEAEQASLDGQDDRIAGLSTRIQQLTLRVSSSYSLTTESIPH